MGSQYHLWIKQSIKYMIYVFGFSFRNLSIKHRQTIKGLSFITRITVYCSIKTQPIPGIPIWIPPMLVER